MSGEVVPKVQVQNRKNKKKKLRGIDRLDKACGCYPYRPHRCILPVGVRVIGELRQWLPRNMSGRLARSV